MAQTIEHEDYVGTTEAARILRTNPKNVQRWLATGRLTAAGVRVQRTIGGRARLHRGDLERLAARLAEPEREWAGGAR